jgi:gliding motility-associated-like protein
MNLTRRILPYAILMQDLVEGMINNGRDITLAFYETPENAENNLFPISNVENYVNQDPYFQTIYVVAENTVTGCKNVNPFMLNLVIVGSPQLPNLDNLVLCDEDTSNQDQATRFDLTQQDTVIEAALGANPGDYIIHYFINETFAQEGAPRITNPSIYNGTNEQTIWVRVEDPATECYGIGSFKLQVRTPLAVVTPPMLAVCNTDLPPDIQAIFDLTTMDATILGPNGVGQGYTVTYYESQDNVNNNISITNPESYSNPAGENPKTLFVVVTTTEGCRSYTTLTVKVLPLPTPNTAPDALELCDDNNSPDGVESFNLTLADGDIRDNDNSTVLSYHLTLENANLDIADIPDFTNHVSGNATIYVRVEANTNNPADPKCYQVVELQLIVNPLPALGEAGVIPPYAICEPATDGYAVFDLNTHNNKVITGGDTTGYTFRYFRNEASALVGAPALRLEGYTNEDPGRQHVWVRVENTQTDCIIIGTFDLLVELEAVANDPEDGHTCDDIDGVNDGVATYDLTQFTAEVLGTTQPEGPGQFLVEYYETDPQLDPDATPIADPANYRNEASPDGVTIYIRAYNDGTISKCSDYTSVDVIIEQLPRPVLQGGTICVDISGAVLRTHTLNTGLPPEYSFVWYHDGVVIPGATGPAYEADEEGNYAVIATSPSGCVSVPITPVEVLQSGPPSAVGTGYSVSNYFSDEQAVTINVEGYGEYEYKLDDGPWQMSNIFTNVSAGQDHTVQVRDASTDNPCSEFILTITGVNIVDYPKYFTPNGDGYHETWNITGFGDDNADAKIYIFDRFGKLVKQISSQSDGWDGTMNGSRLPSTDYWFTVTYREYINGVETIKEFKSHFSLKR